MLGSCVFPEELGFCSSLSTQQDLMQWLPGLTSEQAERSNADCSREVVRGSIVVLVLHDASCTYPYSIYGLVVCC